MRQLVLRGLVLASIYLLVLTSLDPGDVVVSLVLGFGAAALLRPAHGRSDGTTAREALGELAATAAEMVRGSWQVIRFCLGRPCSPGFVEIPRDGRSPRAVARWTILTGVAPGEVVCDVEGAGDTMLIHRVETGDPEAIRAGHRPAAAEREGADA